VTAAEKGRLDGGLSQFDGGDGAVAAYFFFGALMAGGGLSVYDVL